MCAWSAMPVAISRPASATPIEMRTDLRLLVELPVPRGPAATDATMGATEILDGGGTAGACKGGDQ
jgi:hypothetical protein